MIRFFGVLIALAWVAVGWRNMPRLEDPQAQAAGVAIGFTVLIAWWVGRRSSNAYAVAQAVARAEARSEARAAAQASSQAVGNVFVLGNGAGLPADVVERRQYLAGLDNAPWLGGPKPVMEQDVMESVAEDVDLYEYEESDRG